MDWNVLISVLGLAMLTTKMVDTLRNAFDREDKILKAVWNFCAFVLGIGVVYAFTAGGFDITIPGFATANTFGTGLVVGAVASGWHEVLSAVSAKSQ